MKVLAHFFGAVGLPALAALAPIFLSSLPPGASIRGSRALKSLLTEHHPSIRVRHRRPAQHQREPHSDGVRLGLPARPVRPIRQRPSSKDFILAHKRCVIRHAALI